MNRELREAIAEKGKTISTLTGGCWYQEASSKTVLPYAVFSFVTSTSSRDTGSKFEDYYLQINIYSTDGEQVEDLKESFRNEFDDCEKSLTLTSWIVDNVQHELTRSSKLDKVYMITLQYKISLTKR